MGARCRRSPIASCWRSHGEHNVKRVVKAKSMASEEINLNHALEEAGIQALETDLGEYIVQLAGEMPSHIIVPAVHLTKEDIADLFHEKLGVDAPPDPIALAAIARSAPARGSSSRPTWASRARTSWWPKPARSCW